MPLLFQSRPGQVVKLNDPVLQCATQMLGLNPDIDFKTERSIVTRMTLSAQVNVQFLHTLGSQIYIYVFGDRIGSLSLSGLSFACPCPSGADVGAVLMYQWYKRHRASRRKTPVRVMLGRETIEGFITAFTEDLVDPSINLVQWALTLNTLPEDESSANFTLPPKPAQPLPTSPFLPGPAPLIPIPTLPPDFRAIGPVISPVNPGDAFTRPEIQFGIGGPPREPLVDGDV